MTEELKTLTIDGVEYQIADFSSKVQQLISIHQGWEADANAKRLEVAKVEAALRDLTREILSLVKSEIDAKNAPAEDNSEAVTESVN
ncbi:MAG: hypothetical protein QXN55_01645 [Candidatus Nitrosotenuis sp.]